MMVDLTIDSSVSCLNSSEVIIFFQDTPFFGIGGTAL